jgi:hypothetical protein
VIVNAFVIVLDGMPFVSKQLPIFERLPIPFHLTFVEGASMNVHCSAWNKPQEPRLSRDGTTEYLNSIKDHPNVTVIQRESWNGKREMVQAALDSFTEEGCVLEVDCDEFWTTAQLEIIAATFAKLKYVGEMRFFCRYYVGPDLVVANDGGDSFGNRSGEWCRAWRFYPGMQAITHEPPRMTHVGMTLPREKTAEMGLIFDHLSYVTEGQLRLKEALYGYEGALDGWKRLQKATEPRIRLKDYLPWTDENVFAIRI